MLERMLERPPAQQQPLIDVYQANRHRTIRDCLTNPNVSQAASITCVQRKEISFHPT
jgi:hypothetical protein